LIKAWFFASILGVYSSLLFASEQLSCQEFLHAKDKLANLNDIAQKCSDSIGQRIKGEGPARLKSAGSPNEKSELFCSALRKHFGGRAGAAASISEKQCEDFEIRENLKKANPSQSSANFTCDYWQSSLASGKRQTDACQTQTVVVARENPNSVEATGCYSLAVMHLGAAKAKEHCLTHSQPAPEAKNSGLGVNPPDAATEYHRFKKEGK
jgi:hypothetical protein